MSTPGVSENPSAKSASATDVLDKNWRAWTVAGHGIGGCGAGMGFAGCRRREVEDKDVCPLYWWMWSFSILWVTQGDKQLAARANRTREIMELPQHIPGENNLLVSRFTTTSSSPSSSRHSGHDGGDEGHNGYGQRAQVSGNGLEVKLNLIGCCHVSEGYERGREEEESESDE